VQLVEAANGRQVWADRYDATAGDLHAVQDAIAARIARTLAVQIDQARLGLARRAPLASLEVYDCWLRGLECLRKGTVEADAEARRFFERALEIDPAYARAYTGLSLSHFNEWSCQAWTQWDENKRLAHEYARRALVLDETDTMVRVVLGRILVYRHRYDEGAHHLERAVQLNPNDTDVLVHASLGQSLSAAGERSVLLRWFERVSTTLELPQSPNGRKAAASQWKAQRIRSPCRCSARAFCAMRGHRRALR
jgi:tetratricopeptide (TPR) repeat protein